MTADTPTIIVHVDGHLTLIGSLAYRVAQAVEWTMGDDMRNVLTGFMDNPNYDSGKHPFWVNWKDDGVCQMLPALVEEGDQPDLVVVLP